MNTNNHKPKSPLIGANGNIFNLIGIASNTLKENDMTLEAKEMTQRVMSSSSYEEALSIISEYVEPVDAQEYTPLGNDFIDYD